MTQRASFDELLEFANKVRAAGGGNPIDALMPATPQASDSCLIAKNLNFDCRVGPLATASSRGWAMWVDDRETRDKIANALNLKCVGHADQYGLILPESIAQVARDFDDAWDLAWLLKTGGLVTQEGRDLVADMGPYIEASRREVHRFGVFNDKGELIL